MLGRACKIVGSLRSQVTAKQLLYEVRHIVGLIWQSLNNKAILSAEVVSSIPQSLQKKRLFKVRKIVGSILKLLQKNIISSAEIIRSINQ